MKERQTQMLKETTREIIELQNEELRFEFALLGEGKRHYSNQQKDFALSLVDTYGIRGTGRILLLPRRTIQRWCRAQNKRVKRCPLWVYEWAERRRKRREFWQLRGY
jgi:hypothetical protein